MRATDADMVRHYQSQIERLAEVLMVEFEGAFKSTDGGEGAVDMAIRVLREQAETIKNLLPYAKFQHPGEIDKTDGLVSVEALRVSLEQNDKAHRRIKELEQDVSSLIRVINLFISSDEQ